MPVATVVGGTPKLFTMPLMATGKDATLKDMIIWPSAMAIIGTQDSCGTSAVAVLGAAWADMSSSQLFRYWPVQYCWRRSRPNISAVGFRDEQIHSQPLRQEFRDQLALDAVSGAVERRRESP